MAASSDTSARLQLYLDAEASILAGAQSVRMGERQLQRADLEFIQKQIGILQAQLARENAVAVGGGGRFSQADFSGGCR